MTFRRHLDLILIGNEFGHISFKTIILGQKIFSIDTIFYHLQFIFNISKPLLSGVFCNGMFNNGVIRCYLIY